MNEAQSRSLSRPMSASPAGGPVESSRIQSSTRGIARADDVVYLFIGLASAGGWFALYRWYGLLENRNNTHFAFEKIPGGWDSPIIQRTALLFLALSGGYALTAWL